MVFRKKGIFFCNEHTKIKILLVVCFLIGVFLFKPIRSLASVRKLDDYPLFIMHYYEHNITRILMNSALGEIFLDTLEISVMRSDFSSAFATKNLEGYSIMGRNQDLWHPHQTPTLLLIMHPTDGYKSISMVSLDFLEINENKMKWSEHVKLLITPYLVQDGMNEYGLGVAVTAAPCRIGANLRSVPTINSSAAMRIILDQAKSVDEALLILERFDLYFQYVCGHHLLADASGNTAVVEYIDGDMIITRTEYPWQIATNFLMNEYQPAADEGPCWRYRKVAEILGQHHGKISSQKAMQILESISTRTIWSVVYNLTTGSVELSLGRNYKMMYTLSLDMQFEFKYWLKSQQASLTTNLSR